MAYVGNNAQRKLGATAVQDPDTRETVRSSARRPAGSDRGYSDLELSPSQLGAMRYGDTDTREAILAQLERRDAAKTAGGSGPAASTPTQAPTIGGAGSVSAIPENPYTGQVNEARQRLDGYGSFTYDQEALYRDMLAQLLGYGSFQWDRQGQQDAALDRLLGYGPYNYKNEEQLNKLRDQVAGYGPFQWDGQSKHDAVLDQIENYGDFAYEDQEAYKGLLDSIANPEGFQYDPGQDPSFGAMKKMYLREGDRAAENALARASAASGGVPSSYALGAAQQANNYYAGQLADKLPEMERLAYEKYLGQLQERMNALGILQNDRAFQYADWQNRYAMLQGYLANLESDRDFGYQQYLNDFDKLQAGLQTMEADRAFDYETWMSEYNMLHNDLQNLENDRAVDYQDYLMNFDKLQAGLEALESDRDFAYGKWLEGYGMQRDALENALVMEDREQTRLQQEQAQKIENALLAYELMGYATPEVAQVLGIPAGEPMEGDAPGGDVPGNDTGGDYPTDYQSIMDLGYGNLTAQELEALVDKGEVEKYISGGMWRYRKAKKAQEQPSDADSTTNAGGTHASTSGTVFGGGGGKF